MRDTQPHDKGRRLGELIKQHKDMKQGVDSSALNKNYMKNEANFNKMMAAQQRAKNDITPGQASYSTANLEQFSMTPFKNHEHTGDMFIEAIETNKNFAAAQLTYE